MRTTYRHYDSFIFRSYTQYTPHRKYRQSTQKVVMGWRRGSRVRERSEGKKKYIKGSNSPLQLRFCNNPSITNTIHLTSIFITSLTIEQKCSSPPSFTLLPFSPALPTRQFLMLRVSHGQPLTAQILASTNYKPAHLALEKRDCNQDGYDQCVYSCPTSSDAAAIGCVLGKSNPQQIISLILFTGGVISTDSFILSHYTLQQREP